MCRQTATLDAFHTSTHQTPAVRNGDTRKRHASPRIALAHNPASPPHPHPSSCTSSTTASTPTTTSTTTTSTTTRPQLRATLRLPGCARDRRAHKVLARGEPLQHGAHRRAGGGLGVEASDATALAAETHLLRVVVRVRARVRARVLWGGES